ncbi:MAG: rhodanese-like domain-containing protein [Gammaproteobacteria bacterium]|nr:rhodanese-like domain-containing protein [Gammaproteobacteria bacterium]
MDPRSRPTVVLVVGFAATLLSGCDRAPVGAGAGPSLTEVAAAVGRGEDRVNPATLADWLVAGTVAVVDLRGREAFGAGHIRDAVHLPLAEAVSTAGRERLAGRKAVVYGEDGAPGAQAAVLLRLAGVEAYALDGGYRGWLAHLGQPVAAGAANPADGKRLAAACRESAEWAETRTRGFQRVADAGATAAPGPGAPGAMAPPAAPPAGAGPATTVPGTTTPATTIAPPPAVPALPAPPPALPGAPAAFTPPVAPVDPTPAASPLPAEPAGGGLIVNEGC